METRSIGQLQVSVVGLGCNNFGGRMDYDSTVQVIDAALDAGINFFDTAYVYGGDMGSSEELIGRALKGRRNQVLLATKFGHRNESDEPKGRAEYIRRAVEISLRRLDTDVIDLYQMHFPDEQTPIAETVDALNELVKAGKIREFGCSNFSAKMLQDAAAAVKPGESRFESVQNYYSMLHREPETDGVLAECERQSIGILPYFPLEKGLLTGKFRQGADVPQGTRLTNRPEELSDDKLAVVEKLIQFAEARGHTILELAFSWLLTKPVISSVIAGATKVEQIHANAAAANWKLSDVDLQEIDTLLTEPTAQA
jgi:aryl-alcohol dehydrogenase-like predicted oxidoreductase